MLPSIPSPSFHLTVSWHFSKFGICSKNQKKKKIISIFCLILGICRYIYSGKSDFGLYPFHHYLEISLNLSFAQFNLRWLLLMYRERRTDWQKKDKNDNPTTSAICSRQRLKGQIPFLAGFLVWDHCKLFITSSHIHTHASHSRGIVRHLSTDTVWAKIWFWGTNSLKSKNIYTFFSNFIPKIFCHSWIVTNKLSSIQQPQKNSFCSNVKGASILLQIQ